jgi:NADH-quinone oxidoreductase subunit N
VLAIITMTVGNFAALTQSNSSACSRIVDRARRLLIGIVAGTQRSVTAMMIFRLQLHADGAFAVIVLMRRKDVVGDELKDFSGSASAPVAAFAMLLFMLSLGGIPPTAGFMGKFWLFGAAIEGTTGWRSSAC